MPKLVEHRAANALRGVGLELIALALLEAAGSIHQPDEPGLDDVVDLYRRGQLSGEVMRHAAYQWRKLGNAMLDVDRSCGGVHD